MGTTAERRLAWILAASLLGAGCARPLAPSRAAADGPLVVFAPWCMEKRLRRVVEVFQEGRPATPVRFTTGTPGQLLSKVERGARPHVYIAMGPEEVQALEALRLAAPGSASEILRQTLVLAVSEPARDTVKDLRDTARKEITVVGIGQPRLTSGRLTRAALAKLGILDVVEPKAATSPLRSLVTARLHVAVLYGECCYDEDLFVGELVPRHGLAVLKPLPPELCEPFPVLAVAIAGDAAHPAARAFIESLTSRAAQDILHRRGAWACPICEMPQ